jgi:pentapeptide repeat protein
MANQEHLDILKQGVDVWNKWRKEHPEIQPDLSRADLSNACLIDANLYGAILFKANLSRANLTRATLCGAMLVETNLTAATLTNCPVYGISVWKAQLQDTSQDNLVITPNNEPTITVDNLEVAQFIYLLLNNPKIRDVIDTIARKAVLILGRFTPERKAVLDALREELRKQNYLPIVFDFEKPGSRNFTETVKTLAHLSRFIIADLTDPSSIPYELAQVVPGLAVPVQPVLFEGNKAFAMFPDLPRTYHWVLPIHYYTDQAHLLATLQEHVIAPAEQKAQELEKR